MKYTVQAKENCVSFPGVGKDAGTYNNGDLVVISCDPLEKWNIAPQVEYSCNANGVNGYNHKNGNGLNLAFGTMVGSIDGGNTFFPVGTLCMLTITADDTKLQLYCWDTTPEDNSGFIAASIKSYRMHQ